jgi:hypothetical protein
VSSRPVPARRQEEVQTYWRDYGHGIELLQVSPVGRPFRVTRPVQASAFWIYQDGKLINYLFTNFRDADRDARRLANRRTDWDYYGSPNPNKRKRTPMKTRSARYYKSNPLSTTEYVVGGLGLAAVLGIGTYFVYNYYQNQAALNAGAATNAATVAANALPGSSGTPGVSAQQASLLPATGT